MRTSWNKGLTKETDPRVAAISKTKKKGFAEGRLKPSRGNKGMHWTLSEEAKRNHSIARKGKSGTLKGRPQSLELIRKRIEGINKFYETHPRPRWSIPKDSQQYKNMSKTFFGHGQSASFPNEKNGMWNGGLSFEPYSQEFNSQFKELIKQRDNYICQLCGIPECECKQPLCCHHIDYNKKNNLPTNIITLCWRCNSKVNANREHWKELFAKKIQNIQDGYQLKLNLLIREGKSKYPIVTGRGIIG